MMGVLAHVTILIANLPAEKDRRVIRQCLSLEAAGFCVTVIAPRGDRSLKTLPGSRGTRLRPYPVPVTGSGILSFGFEFLWSFACIAVRLVGEVLAGRAHGVQVCNPPDVYWPLALLLRALGRPWVFDHHDLCPEVYATRSGGNPRRIVYRTLELFESLTMRTATMVSSTNESFREIALRRGVKPEKVIVVRNGPSQAELLGSPSRPDAVQRIVYLGVLGPQDNVRGAVLAADELTRLRGREGWRLTIAGDGEELAALKRLTAERELGDVVDFTGWLGPEAVDELLRQATCAVQPDLATRMNQLSTMAKTVEYLGRGVPVVAVDLLETRRTAGDAAIYVPTGDPAEFAKALDELLRDDAQRERMRDIGLQRFTTMLSWDHQAVPYVAMWRRLLAKRLPSAIAGRRDPVSRKDSKKDSKKDRAKV
jgi:glycosyltransferase involved in cell wall biosynthesis